MPFLTEVEYQNKFLHFHWAIPHLFERLFLISWENNIHLMSDPEGNSKFCFSESPDVSRDEVEGNIRTRGKTKLTGFLRDLTLSV